MKLIPPSLALKEAFLNFYQDLVHYDVENSHYYSQCAANFSGYVQSLIDESNGINLRDGYVPCSHFWLVDESQSVLGVIRVRHNISTEHLRLEAGHIGYDIAPSYRNRGYGKKMLELALPKALHLGITNALVTADEDNTASRKVIEANGGRLDNIVVGKVFPYPLARYWVNCCAKDA